MRAAVIEGGKFVVRDVAEPKPAHDELLIRVHGCGVCGSDLKTYPLLPDGTIMGHEFAGEVVAAGEAVAEQWPDGTAVASMPVIGCGTCVHCIAGDPARCPAPQALGLGIRAGGFAEYVTVAASGTVALDPSLDLRSGALVEPLAVGLHAMNRGDARVGDRLLVVGAGPVGLSVVIWARAQGITDITICDPVHLRRQAALDLGATHAYDPTTENIGTGFDLVVECVGKTGMIAACLDAVGPRGRIVIAGVCMEPDTFMPLGGIIKDVTMSFVSYYTVDEFRAAAAALTDGSLELGGFVSGYATLDDLQEVVDGLSHPSDQQKVIITPR
ncbi:zinc-binding dehydrogenase [Nocardia sp. 348MFTsu5.1]|uniref:zinc-dependent alcohol dehydrogenase n=1 Tax=Nocardia sp. 348MFTsu5.1 TaxID=1172185 RepID=UPI00036D8E71|nr:alcohol dehydrogenase catalytic domain-containing protein [Nocardia sp. 348MFTsu5.1]